MSYLLLLGFYIPVLIEYFFWILIVSLVVNYVFQAYVIIMNSDLILIYVLFYQIMRLDTHKRRAGGLLSAQRSCSVDSTDEDFKIRLDDPSLRLTILESPDEPPTFSFGDAAGNDKLKMDANMNTHNADHVTQQTAIRNKAQQHV